MALETITVSETLNNLITPAKLERLTKKACLEIERDAKEMCPTDTGALRASINTDVSGSGMKWTGTVGTPLPYAPYVEYGTGLFAAGGDGRDTPWVYFDEGDQQFYYTQGQEPQPFLTPAYEQNKKTIERIFREGLMDV